MTPALERRKKVLLAPVEFLGRLRQETRLDDSYVVRDSIIIAGLTLPVLAVALAAELRARAGSATVAGVDPRAGLWSAVLLVLIAGLCWFAYRRLRELDTAFTTRKQLEHEVIRVAEFERTRIGQDLHDGLGQALTGIGFMSHALAHRLEKSVPGEAAEARRIGELVNAAIRQTREMARGLYPVELADNGLISGLDALVRGAEDLLDLDCRLSAQENANVLDRAKALHLYRIAQEAIDNAARHGEASLVRVSLSRRGSRVVLSVEDNGRGLPPSASTHGGLGLRIMEDRANLIGADFEMGRGEQGGTYVRCSLVHAQLPVELNTPRRDGSQAATTRRGDGS